MSLLISFTVMFTPLSRDQVRKIAELLLKHLKTRLAERQVELHLTDAAMNLLLEQGYDPTYGARPLKRYLQKYVETAAAKIIVTGNISQGDTILVDVEDGKLTAKVK